MCYWDYLGYIETLLSSDLPAASTVPVIQDSGSRDGIDTDSSSEDDTESTSSSESSSDEEESRMARSNESQNEEDPGTPYFVVFIYDLLAYYVHKDNTASRHELIATNQSEFTIEAPPTRIGRPKNHETWMNSMNAFVVWPSRRPSQQFDDCCSVWIPRL